jgi:VanZ family protein
MFVLGLLLESGQHLSPGRSVDLGDVIANGASAVSGVLKAISTRILL